MNMIVGFLLMLPRYPVSPPMNRVLIVNYPEFQPRHTRSMESIEQDCWGRVIWGRWH